MYRLKTFSSVGACTSLFAVVLFIFVEAACDGKGPINSNKEGGLASAPQASPMSNLNASANTSARDDIPARNHISVAVKGKEVSVDTGFSEVVGSVSKEAEGIRDKDFVGLLRCSGRFIFGEKDIEAGRYLMWLRHASPRGWRLLLFRPGAEPRVDQAIAMMPLDEKPGSEDQRKPDVELEAFENYAVITIRLANVELKGKLIVL